MDFESPAEAQKDFFCSGKKEDSEFPEKKEKEKKDKKDKKDKDKGYATLAGDSSPDEDGDTKSPSKSTKRIKAFKFPLKKEKREKSRDKELPPPPEKEPSESKKKDKKEKKEKRMKSSSGVDELQELGDVLPIFGVSLELAVERSRCHDAANPLPLVVRDCIDYLQDAGVPSEGVYKVDPVKAKLQHLKKLYNNRESNGWSDLEVATAGGLLTLYLRELPEPPLTTKLISQFEEVSAKSDVQEQETLLKALVTELPGVNQTLLKWIFLHLDAVTENAAHKINAQQLAMELSPTLQMSHRLFAAILCHCRSLFSAIGVETRSLLPRYIPPLSGANPVLPEDREEVLREELRKQESVLSQIHSEMNSGFVTKRREEQLWEVQRIITQLKRKLRPFDKKGESAQKSVDDCVDETVATGATTVKSSTVEVKEETENTSKEILTITESGFLALPADHPEAAAFLQLQLENLQLQKYKQQLQSAILKERAEIVTLKKQLQSTRRVDQVEPAPPPPETEQDRRAMTELLSQNVYLESVRSLLCEKIIEEQRKIVDLNVQFGLAELAGH